MPCVNDHPEFLKMAADWADPLIADLLSAEAMVVNSALAGVSQAHEHHHHHGDHHHHHDDHHHGDHHHH
jgi:ferrochelatase